MYTIEIDKQAAKNMMKIPTAYQLKIIEHIDKLKSNPHPKGSVKLKGSDITYRIRVGVYRIIYDIHNHVLLIRIVSVDHRKDVCR